MFYSKNLPICQMILTKCHSRIQTMFHKWFVTSIYTPIHKIWFVTYKTYSNEPFYLPLYFCQKILHSVTKILHVFLIQYLATSDIQKWILSISLERIVKINLYRIFQQLPEFIYLFHLNSNTVTDK